MRVDFYQLSRDPVERVAAVLAGKATQAGLRVLVVCADAGRRQAISDALWAQDGAAFLAHGMAGEEHEARQPILVSAGCETANGATMAIIADGQWRPEAEGFERALLLFDGDATGAARELWRALSAREDIDNRIFKQGDGGGWREGA